MDKEQKQKLIDEAIKQARGDIIIGEIGSYAAGNVVGKDVYQDVEIKSENKTNASTISDDSKQTKSKSKIDKAALYKILVERFNLSELKDLCFRLNIDYEQLEGDNKSDKARELITYCLRHGQIEDLLSACQALRPKVFD